LEKGIRICVGFFSDKIEDGTQRYMLQWEAIEQQGLKNKKNAIDFLKVYSGI
jgi:hypothetical protein